MVFTEYCGLRGIIGERLFVVMDEDGDGVLEEGEWLEGMSTLFTCPSHLVFSLYDFDSDGYITHQDCKIILGSIEV